MLFCDDQGILQSDWAGTCWHITCEGEFSQVWGLKRKTDNCKVFHFGLLSGNSNVSFYKNSRKFIWAHLWHFLPILV